MIKIFNYLPELDCFVVNPGYKAIADKLGLSEWNEVVWIGRFFAMDNDFGEHWFDNWDLRELLEEKVKSLGFDSTELFILDANRFKDGRDGPCHSPDERLSFWKDVLLSLHLSHETLFNEARKINEERKAFASEEYIADLEERIAEIIHQRKNTEL